MISRGIADGHPVIKMFAQDPNRNPENRHPWKQQRRNVLTETSDRNRPSGIEQMMKQNQKRRTRADAEKKHVSDQIRESELTAAVVVVTDSPSQTDGHQNDANDDQARRDFPPFGKIQRRKLGRFFMRTHNYFFK